MDALECIHTRRSIRRYQKKAVSQETLRQIVEAGMMAPSAGNEQPWEFVVITDRGLLTRIPEIHPYAAMAAEAPAAILVCGNVLREKYKGLWVQDCAAATQNILLAAHALGLGAVWTAVHPMADREEGFRKLFDLPREAMPFALIPLGYPAQKAGRAERFDPTRIHPNRW